MKWLKSLSTSILVGLITVGSALAQDTTMTVTDNKIGIGTTTPRFPVHIAGPRGEIYIRPDINIFRGTVLLNESRGAGFGPQQRFSGINGRGFIDIGQDSAGAFVVEGNDNIRLTVENSGNVGIGITTPKQKLDIDGGSMRISNSGLSDILLERPYLYLNQVGTPAGNVANLGGGLMWQAAGENQMEMFYTNRDSGLFFWNPQSGPRSFIGSKGGLWSQGIIESREGGFKFPDGSMQTTASTGGSGNSPWSPATTGSGIFYGDNVGIGTNAPRSPLEVNGTIRAIGGGDKQLIVSNSDQDRKAMSLYAGNNESSLHFSDNGPFQIRSNTKANIETGVWGGDARLFIDQTGNFGINTITPTEMLQVADFSTASDNYISVKSAGGQVYKSGIKLRHFDETNGFTIYSDDAFSGGRIGLHILRHHITFPEAGRLALFIDRLNGNVGFATNTPSHPLEMASGAHVTAGGVWTNASSRELKENISSLGAGVAISALNALEPVQYNYKSEKGESYLGFIAEDVPEIVATKDRKSLSPMDVVALLTKVVQEQQKQINALQARLDGGQ